jgi:serine/threonine-protein kinase
MVSTAGAAASGRLYYARDGTTRVTRSQGSHWSAGGSGAVDLRTEEGRAFLQERLAFFGAVGFLFQCGFFVFGRAALAISVPHLLHLPTTFGMWAMLLGDLGGQILYLSLWAYARRGRRPLGVLRAIEVFLPFLTCTLAVLPLAKGGMASGAPFAALLVVFLVLMARAVVVPSEPRRTLRVGIACSLPLLLLTADLRLPLPLLSQHVMIPFLMPGVLWTAAAIALSTMTSAILFGLRRRVEEARRLGQYTLEAKLGEGGMGTVYRARHAMLRRPTAIKLLPPERTGGSSLERFEREVQATALLSHPNTVQVYDFGRTPDGIFYYAMEYLEGVDLDTLVRGFGPQPPGRVVHVLGQVAGALGEAHRAGLIHRDVKPGNVILCERGGAPDVAKVVDFGLVRDLSQERRLTESALDVITGTPLYLSPEAITAPLRIDGRSDLYAVGALGYFLLTGRNPFEGATVVEVCAHHLHTTPERPSARLGQPVPGDLEDVVLACLEKSPARRPQSAQELLERLESCASAGEWGERQARAWWRANSGRIAALRAEPRAGVPSPTSPPTMAVSLEERLEFAGGPR